MFAPRLFSLVIAACLALMSLCTAVHATEHAIAGEHQDSFCQLFHHGKQLGNAIAALPTHLDLLPVFHSVPTTIAAAPTLQRNQHQSIRAPPVLL